MAITEQGILGAFQMVLFGLGPAGAVAAAGVSVLEMIFGQDAQPNEVHDTLLQDIAEMNRQNKAKDEVDALITAINNAQLFLNRELDNINAIGNDASKLHALAARIGGELNGFLTATSDSSLWAKMTAVTGNLADGGDGKPLAAPPSYPAEGLDPFFRGAAMYLLLGKTRTVVENGNALVLDDLSDVHQKAKLWAQHAKARFAAMDELIAQRIAQISEVQIQGTPAIKFTPANGFLYLTDSGAKGQTVGSWRLDRQGFTQPFAIDHVVWQSEIYPNYDTAKANLAKGRAQRDQYIAGVTHSYRDSIGYSVQQEANFRAAALHLSQIQLATANPQIPSYCSVQIHRVKGLQKVLHRLDSVMVGVEIVGGAHSTPTNTTWTSTQPATPAPAVIPSIPNAGPLLDLGFELLESPESVDYSIVFHVGAKGQWTDPSDHDLRDLKAQTIPVSDLISAQRNAANPLNDVVGVSRERSSIEVEFTAFLT